MNAFRSRSNWACWAALIVGGAAAVAACATAEDDAKPMSPDGSGATAGSGVDGSAERYWVSGRV